MTERQEHILRVLADPCSGRFGLGPADRAAIQAALDEIARLRAESDRLRSHLAERLKQHRENLRLWESGYLAPTEPDPDERAAVARELKAAIDEIELITGGAA